jgi:hypothetical protein
MSTHVSPEQELQQKQRQAVETLTGQVTVLKEKIIRLETEIEQRQQLVEKKRKAALLPASKEEGDALKLEVSAHETKIRQAEDELILTKGQLEALKRSRAV